MYEDFVNTLFDPTTDFSYLFIHDTRPLPLKALYDPPYYYRLLYELARQHLLEGRGIRALEIGTDTAVGTAHLAYPAWASHCNPEGQRFGQDPGLVATMDINSVASENARRLSMPNVMALTQHSTKGPTLARSQAYFDLLFVDGEHVAEQAWEDYVICGNYVRPGGVMLFDDIDMNDDMRRMWGAIKEEKVVLSSALFHETGFGVVRRSAVRGVGL